jgi:hypothetical protein
MFDGGVQPNPIFSVFPCFQNQNNPLPKSCMKINEKLVNSLNWMVQQPNLNFRTMELLKPKIKDYPGKHIEFKIDNPNLDFAKAKDIAKQKAKEICAD